MMYYSHIMFVMDFLDQGTVFHSAPDKGGYCTSESAPLRFAPVVQHSPCIKPKRKGDEFSDYNQR